jgi:transcriptional regulator with XRE-family HTH domain
MSSRLVGLIDEYKDSHGRPSDSSIARAIGVVPQTVSNWRTRGIRKLPEPGTLRRLAAFIKVDERIVFNAAATDAGYFDEPSPTEVDEVREAVRAAKAAGATPAELLAILESEAG